MASFTINAEANTAYMPVVALKTFNVAFRWSPCICHCCTRPTHEVHSSSPRDGASRSYYRYIFRSFTGRLMRRDDYIAANLCGRRSHYLAGVQPI